MNQGIPSLETLRDALAAASRPAVAQYLARHEHPRFLYKMSAPRPIGLAGTIVRSELWLASRRDFNDPFEMEHVVITFEGTEHEKLACLRRAARNSGTPLGQRHAAAEAALRRGTFIADAKKAFDDLVDRWGVCCFGTRPRNVQMWGYYGNQRGVCYQFHLARSPVPLAEAVRVRYSDELIRINWARDGHVENHLGETFFTKAKAWDHEGEYRIIERNGAGTALAFQPDALVGLIFGCMARRFTELRVVVLCRRRRLFGMPAIKLYRAVRKQDLSLDIKRALDLEGLLAGRSAPLSNPKIS